MGRTCGYASDANPSSYPNHWPHSSCSSSRPATDTAHSATKEPRRGCSPAGSPAVRSAATSSANASDSSDCAPAKPARRHCSSLPPNFPQPCSPECSEFTSPSPGNAPAAATGPDTPPPTAAANDPPPSPSNPKSWLATERHSDSSNIRLRQFEDVFD